jgi:L-2-hydroxyglutarate oxidase LhgO
MGARLERLDVSAQSLQVSGRAVAYGHVVNAAGTFADRVAHWFGVGDRYSILPFRGSYFGLVPDCPLRINGLIYPVPDLNMPFLGIHSLKTWRGEDLLGPSAFPAFGREHYSGTHGMELRTALAMCCVAGQQYLENTQGFRRYLHRELGQWTKAGFAAAARRLLPGLKSAHLCASPITGIRAQLFDHLERRLVMDFLVLDGPASTHVLNVVSPGFTSGISFGQSVVERILSQADR